MYVINTGTACIFFNVNGSQSGWSTNIGIFFVGTIGFYSFKALEKMNDKDKSTIKDVIDAFIKGGKLRNIAAL
ncbi:MAG: hypothetical protein AB7S69_04495 [Salinivirgaceae bacterium]